MTRRWRGGLLLGPKDLLGMVLKSRHKCSVDIRFTLLPHVFLCTSIVINYEHSLMHPY